MGSAGEGNPMLESPLDAMHRRECQAPVSPTQFLNLLRLPRRESALAGPTFHSRHPERAR